LSRTNSTAVTLARTAVIVGFVLVASALGGSHAAYAQVATPGSSYAERVLARADLLAFWRLGETSGSAARDERGARHGTYAGGVTLGRPGALSADPDSAASFDGNDDSVMLPTLSSHTSFTIEAWQRVAAGAAGNNALYGKTTVRLMPRPTGYYADTIAGSRYTLQGTSTSNVGQWVHWALVRSGATLQLYRDGVRVAQRSDLPAGTPTDLSGQIGRSGTAYPTKGEIDEVAVYSTALSAQEIADDYAARDVAPGSGTPPPPPPPGPLHVDRGSLGGACDDAYTPAQVQSPATPWCSLERAAQASPGAATVLVRAATYPSVAIDGLIRSARVTFKPFAGELPVLDGLSVTNSSFLRFESFRITDVTHLDQASQVQLVGNDISPHDVRIVSGSDLLFEDNTIHDLTMEIDPTTGRCVPPRCGYGIRINSGSDITIRDNRFERIPADGIQSGTAVRYLIEGNTFEDITAFVDPEEHSDAIQFYGGSQDVTVRRNSFLDTRGPLFLGLAAGAAQRDLVIENNVIVRQRDWGLKVFNAPRLRLVNNTVWDARTGVVLQDTLAISEPTRDAVLINNVIDSLSVAPVMLAREDHNLIGAGYRAGVNDLGGPPRFVDPVAADYRLAGGSPGIDAGTSDGASDHDRIGAARVDTPAIPNTGGGAQPFYEMGAFEFTANYTPPGGSYADRVLGVDGLLSYWRLGERSGTVAADEKGGRDGTYLQSPGLGAPGALASDADTAVAFDGINDQVSLPALPSSVDFTVEGWMRLRTGSAGNNALYGQTGNLRFMPRTNGFYAGVWINGVELVIQASTASNVDRWVHWALLRRGGVLEVYRDGIRVGSRSGVSSTAAVNLTGAIGRIGLSYPANASVDELAVYGSALSSTELRAHRDLGTGSPSG